MFSRSNKTIELQDKKVSIPAERYSSLLTEQQTRALERIGGSNLVKELKLQLRVGVDMSYNRSLEARLQNPRDTNDSSIDLAAKRTQLSSAIKQIEAACTQAEKTLAERNPDKRANLLQKLAADVDAVVDAATNGLIIGHVPHVGTSNMSEPLGLVSGLKGRTLVLNALRDCLTSAKDAGAGYQDREAARKQLTKSIDAISHTLQGTPFQQNGSPEIALLKTVCETRASDPFVDLQQLKEALTFAEDTGQTERNAKSLATTHDRAELLGLSQAALQEGDLLKALTCVKAVLYQKDATTGDLSNLAQIYRRQGADDVEFLTLRGMLDNRHLTWIPRLSGISSVTSQR